MFFYTSRISRQIQRFNDTDELHDVHTCTRSGNERNISHIVYWTYVPAQVFHIDIYDFHDLLEFLRFLYLNDLIIIL